VFGEKKEREKGQSITEQKPIEKGKGRRNFSQV